MRFFRNDFSILWNLESFSCSLLKRSWIHQSLEVICWNTSERSTNLNYWSFGSRFLIRSFDLHLYKIFQMEFIKLNKPAGKDLAKIIAHSYQTYIINTSTEFISITVDKSTLSGMQECLVGNKSPTDFFNIQKQVQTVYLFQFFICNSL